MRWALLLVLLAGIAPAAEWNVRYFFDDARETLHFTALAFPSAMRGIAAGVIVDEEGKRKPRNVAVITADGGNTWSQIKLDDEPVSMFFLDDSTGWMVGQRGIWKTEESGRTWKRISRQSNGKLLKVWFLDAMHGFAVGREKTVLESFDGGKSWKKVKAAEEPTGNKKIALYSQISFMNSQIGLIVGSAIPPTTRGFNTRARQVPTMTLQLQTLDGGKTWKPTSAPLIGEVTGLEMRGDTGLALFSFTRSFELLSEVYELQLRTGGSPSVFKGKDRRVTDMALFLDRAYLVAVEPPPRAEEPAFLPGAIHVLVSEDFKDWKEMPVDYQASGAQPLIDGPDADHMFVATDSGMILRLEQ